MTGRQDRNDRIIIHSLTIRDESLGLMKTRSGVIMARNKMALLRSTETLPDTLVANYVSYCILCKTVAIYII